MNSMEDNLREALRELGAAAPPGAPPELGGRLKDAFARHQARRRQKRMALAASLAASLAISISLVWWAGPRHSQPAMAEKNSPAPSTTPREATPAPTIHIAAAPRAVVHATKARRQSKSQVRDRLLRPAAIMPTDFIALPSFDPAIPFGQARIVRVDMPGSALQLVGYPVNEELLQRRVLTDILVGQDGLPYAVRLVQSRANR